MSKMRETIVVNLLGGPGAGKTTCAWLVAAELKKLGYVAEYVSEYAKELVWDGREDLLVGTLENQKAVYQEQKKRVDRLIGKVDFVVTDSPIILSKVYLNEPNAEFEKEMIDDFNKYHNFCIFVERGDTYEREGRLQTLEQAKGLDSQIKTMIDECGFYCGVYRHSTLGVAIDNMQKTYKRFNTKEHKSLDAKIDEAKTGKNGANYKKKAAGKDKEQSR